LCDGVDQNAPLEEQIAKSRYLLALGLLPSFESLCASGPASQRRRRADIRRVFGLAGVLACRRGWKGGTALVGRARVLSAEEPWVKEVLQKLYPSPMGMGDRTRPDGPQPKICPGADNVAFRAELWKLALKKRWKGPGLSGWTFNRMICVWDCNGDPS